jgi:serine/threonine protein kinase
MCPADVLAYDALRNKDVDAVIPARLHAVFTATLEQPTHLRDAFLRQACGPDSQLFREVGDLLDLHARLESEAGKGFAFDTDALTGATFGAYRIVKFLGSGGMGRVYLAARADGVFERQVAIKIINQDAVQLDSIARFEAECRLLGSLQHPSIATLFDAGRTAAGLLYIVMEYVDGPPITTYCERNALSLRAKISLFLRVCDAVAAAHRNLIVHRDLKPANVLVDAQGTPKLLDFGIAKQLTRGGLEASSTTDPLYRPVTPAYASPEQLKGRSVHTGMDVYALGVILHEVLTGRRPDAVAPSTVDGGDNLTTTALPVGHAEYAVPAEELDDELGLVLSKALDREPQRRYESVDALSSDLLAYLDHRPITARAQTYVYRSRKFLRRNPVLSVVAATAIAAVVVAIGGLARLWQQESGERAALEERVDAARLLAASLFDVDRTLADLPGVSVPRQALVESLSRYLERLRQTVGSDPRLLRELAESLRRVADILGNPHGPNLGDRRRALASYQLATDLLRQLRRVEDDRELTYMLALTRAGAADVLSVGEQKEAGLAYNEALGLLDDLERERPETRFRALSAGLHRSLGDLLLAQRQLDAALEHYEKALGIELAFDGHATDPERRQFVAATRVRIGSAQAARGAWRESLSQYEAAIDDLQSLAESGLPRRLLMRDLGVALLRLADSSKAVDVSGSMRALAKGIDILRPLAHEDPTDARLQRDLLGALVQYGDAQRSRDFGAARDKWIEALEIAQGLNALGGSDSQSARDLQMVQERLGSSFGTHAPELSLYAVADGEQVEWIAGQALPEGTERIAVRTQVPKGWTQYIITFGAWGEATILDEVALQSMKSIVSITGPPPSQTILLLALPRALGQKEREQLATSLGAVPVPREVDYDAHVIWSDADDRIVSEITARRSADTDWVNDVRVRLANLRGARFSARTFWIPD